MRFDKNRRWKNNKNNPYKKKIKLKTKIMLVGVIFVVAGFLVGIYDDSEKNRSLASHQQYFVISIGLIIAGMAMILQKKLLVGLKDLTKEHCNCCKCTNCDRGHNHWTHDDDDTRRKHY